MKRNVWCRMCIAVFALSAITSGCNNAATDQAATEAAKPRPPATENPQVPTEAKTQIESASEKSAAKGSAYSKDMAEQYSKNPPTPK